MLNLKRLFDFCISLIGLLLLWPVLIVVAALVYSKLGLPIFFRQERVGKNGKVFKILKFRTLSEKRNAKGIYLDDSLRLSKFGAWLRSTSLDELPELWNVLRGQMSLVGPRPLLIDYLQLYTKEQSKRHNVRPGITGWAQVNGRNAQTWSERLRLDVWYVENQSFFLDLKILCKTIFVVLKREGVSAEGVSTMPKYDGTEK